MQPVIWVVEFSDGTVVHEFHPETGKETIFTEILPRKSEMVSISLLAPDQRTHPWSIDLKTGTFIIQGENVHPAKEIEGRVFRVTNLPVNYAEGVIQFKCSIPLTIGVVTPITAATYNIGYKVAVPNGSIHSERWVKGTLRSTVDVTHVQPMISIDARTFQPSIAVSATMTVKNVITGEETSIRI